MQHAKVIGPHDDKLKFEVVSTIAKYRFYLKADHPLEAIRWVEELKAHIDAAGPNSAGSASSDSLARASYPNTAASSVTAFESQSGPPLGKRASAALGSMFTGPPRKPATRAGSTKAQHSDAAPGELTDDQADAKSVASLAGSVEMRDDGSVITAGAEYDESSRPPQEESFSLLASTTKAQIETTQQLLDSLIITPEPLAASVSNGSSLDVRQAGGRPSSVHSNSSSLRQAELKDALRESLQKLNAMFEEYTLHVGQRERWFSRRYDREIDARRLWEDNMHKVAAQQEELEQQLSRELNKGSRRKKELREARMIRTRSSSSARSIRRPRPPLVRLLLRL
jgi:hypothetical protein